MLKKKNSNDFHHTSNRNTPAVRDCVAPLQNAVINKKIKIKTTRRKFIHKKNLGYTHFGANF